MALAAAILTAAWTMPGRAERYLILGDSLSREYQFEFTEFDAARNWVEILAAIRPGDFDFGKVRTVDLTFIDDSWDLRSHAYNWSLPTFSADAYRGLLQDPGLEDRLFRALVNPVFNETERVIIFLGGNDLDRIYNEIYQGRDANNSGVKAIYADLEDILDEVEGRGGDLGIVLVNVPHVGATPEVKSAHPFDAVKTQRVSDALALLNRQLKKLAEARDAAYVDVYTLTEGLIDPAPLCIGGVPFINDSSDEGDPGHVWLGGSLAAGFHPNTNGQALIAREIINAINEHFDENIPPLADGEILQAVLGISPSLPFESWIAGYGVPSPAEGPEDDADGDGVKNLVECALDMHPLRSDAHRLPVPSVSMTEGSPYLTMSYRPRVQDCPYVRIWPQQSADLRAWSGIPESAVSTSSDGAVTLRLPLTGTTYLRLLVTQGAP